MVDGLAEVRRIFAERHASGVAPNLAGTGGPGSQSEGCTCRTRAGSASGGALATLLALGLLLRRRRA